MKTEFTPAPWSMNADSINCIVIEGVDGDICQIMADNEDDLLTALEWDNARLISYAPELFNCLKQLVEAHENDRTKDYGWLLEIGRSIIDKAENN